MSEKIIKFLDIDGLTKVWDIIVQAKVGKKEEDLNGEVKGEVFNDYSINEFGTPNNIASGIYSHAEGSNTIASGNYSHAQGLQTESKGSCSFASGEGTVANGDVSFVIGKYNQPNQNFIFVVGNGENSENRSNLLFLDRDGNLSTQGNIKGSNIPEGRLATIDDVSREVARITLNAPENFNSLRKISNWINNDENSAAAMNNQIQENKTNLDKKVDKIDGMGLSKNNFTDEEKEKLQILNNYDDSKINLKINTLLDKIKELERRISILELEKKMGSQSGIENYL